MWVLIVTSFMVVGLGKVPVVSMQEFGSEVGCKNAAFQIRAAIARELTAKQSLVHTVCVPR